MDSFIEIIGSIIAFVLLFIFFLRQGKPLFDEEEFEEQEIRRKKSRQSKKVTPQAPPAMARPLPRQEKMVKSEHYEVKRLDEAPSRGAVMLRQLSDPQKMIVIQEIIGPPKGLY